MNYTQIYNSLITKRQNEILSKEIYGEKHHIIPKCLGGTDDKSNLVRLTAREHYIAHLLLAKIYNTFGLYSAVTYMQTGHIENRKFKFNSHLYQKMREEFTKKQKGKKLSEETKRKLSEANKGKIPWNKGKDFLKNDKNPFYGKHHSEEAKRKMSEKSKGRYIGRTPTWLKGKTLSNEHKQKDREAMLGMVFWNNGQINVRARECPEGFIKGRIKKTNKPVWNKGKTNIFSKETKQKISESLKGNKRALGYKHSEEHKQKMSESRKGRHWYNNGIINKFCLECPEGFVKGIIIQKISKNKN